jgi:SH3-like domain-containing protein
MRTAARLICASLATALAAATPAAAGDEDGQGAVTNLPVPRYVSLRSSEINVRRGPGLDYRKDWVFRRAGLPVRIVEEYGDWRRIVDKDDAGGWVYHAMLTGRRTVQVTAEQAVLRAEPSETAAPVARAEQGVVARLEACLADWCEIEAEGYDGWVPKAAIWGVDPGEIVEP